jgi:hypothetical protein
MDSMDYFWIFYKDRWFGYIRRRLSTTVGSVSPVLPVRVRETPPDTQPATLFHINRFQRKLLARDDLDADTAAIGTLKRISVVRMVLLKTGHTLELRWDDTEMQLCTFGNRVFGDDIPVELDGLVHQLGQLTHDDVQVGNAFGVRFLGVFEGNIEDGLCDGEFVHGGDYSIGEQRIDCAFCHILCYYESVR